MAVSASDLDNMAWTMLGEAWPGDVAGMTAVGSVINNRLQSGRYGSSITKVVKSPNQFAAWGIGSQAREQANNPDRRFSTMSPQFRQARALAEQIVAGQVADPTGGALEYRQTGTTRRQGTDIGGNTFFAPPSSAMAYAPASSQTASIQQQLANAGFNPGPIDGINGPQTKAAIKAFQKANGLTADGIVGPQTSAVMAAMGTAPTTFGGRLPTQAQYGVDRLTPGKATLPPTGFSTDTGTFDSRLAGMIGPQGVLSAGGRVGTGLPVPGGAALAGMPPLPAPRPLIAPPVQASPPPLPGAPVTPPAAPQTVLTANGNRVAVGIHDQGDHSVMVSDDGTGHARIERIRSPMSVPGVIDPLREANAPTLAGGYIRSLIPKMASDAVAGFSAPAAVDNVKNAAVGAAGNLGSTLGGFGSNIGSAFSGLGGLFGARPPLPSGPTLAQLQAIRAVPANSYFSAAPIPHPRPLFAAPQIQTPNPVGAPPPMPDPLQMAVLAAQRNGETYDRSRDPSFNPNGGAHGGSLAGF